MNHEPPKISGVFSLQANCFENICVITPHFTDIHAANPRTGAGTRSPRSLKPLIRILADMVNIPTWYECYFSKLEFKE